MESKVEKIYTMTLKLNAAEVNWLKSLVQNPIRSDFHEDVGESVEDENMRLAFFEALGGKRFQPYGKPEGVMD